MRIFFHSTFLVLVFAAFIVPLLRLYSGRATIYDLGVTVSALERAFVEPNFFVSATELTHFFVFLPLIASLTKFLDQIISPEVFLLLLQSSVIVCTFLHLYIYKSKFIGILGLLYPPVWGILLFDFHFDVLSIPIIYGIYLCYEKNSYWKIFVLSIALCFTKEYYALICIFTSIILLIINIFKGEKNRRTRLILILIVITSSAYFYIVQYHIILGYSAVKSSGLDGGSNFLILSGDILYDLPNKFGELIKFFLLDIYDIKYILIIFGTLLFIPFLSVQYIFPIFPIILISLLSSDRGHVSPYNHYTSTIIIPAIYATLVSINNSRLFIGLSKYCIYIIMIILCAFFSIRYVLINVKFNTLYKDIYQTYNYKNIIAINKNFQVTAPNNFYYPGIASRYFFDANPMGIISPINIPLGSTLSSSVILEKYVIIRNNPPIYILDKLLLDPINDVKYIEFINFLNDNYSIFYSDQIITIYKNK